MDRAAVQYFLSGKLTLCPKFHVPCQLWRRRSYDKDTGFFSKRIYCKFGFRERVKFFVIRDFFCGIQIEISKILFRLYVIPGERKPTL